MYNPFHLFEIKTVTVKKNLIWVLFSTKLITENDYTIVRKCLYYRRCEREVLKRRKIIVGICDLWDIDIRFDWGWVGEIERQQDQFWHYWWCCHGRCFLYWWRNVLKV